MALAALLEADASFKNPIPAHRTIVKQLLEHPMIPELKCLQILFEQASTSVK